MRLLTFQFQNHPSIILRDLLLNIRSPRRGTHTRLRKLPMVQNRTGMPHSQQAKGICGMSFCKSDCVTSGGGVRQETVNEKGQSCLYFKHHQQAFGAALTTVRKCIVNVNSYIMVDGSDTAPSLSVLIGAQLTASPM